MREFTACLLKKASLILLTSSIFSGATHAACQEEQKHCYYFEGDKLISDSACEVVQCANISGGLEVWTWSNGNKVDVQVQNGETKVNGQPGRFFDKDALSCYEIIGSDREALCNGNPLSNNAPAFNTGANDKRESCLRILGAGIYNGILETLCDFNGGVKEKLKEVYAKAGCPSIINGNEISHLSEEVLVDTRERYQVMGEEAFCEGNKEAYFDLAQD